MRKSIAEPEFWEYITVDKNGFMNGIRPDAPEEIKNQYKEFMAEDKKMLEKGIKL